MKTLPFGVLVVAALSLALPPPAAAFRYVDVGQPAPALALVDVLGRSIALPVARPALLLFWRADQDLSEQALADVAALRESERPGVDVAVYRKLLQGRK